MVSPAARLEKLICEFTKIEPTLPSLLEEGMLGPLQEISQGIHPNVAIFGITWSVGRFTFAPYYCEEQNEIRIGLVPDEDDFGEDAFSEVYRCILAELCNNLGLSGKVAFYPAIGYDWRICEEWPATVIVGIDPMPYEWTGRNIRWINKCAVDYDEVQSKLKELDLPEKADILVLKGISFALGNKNLGEFVSRYLNPGGYAIAFGKGDIWYADRCYSLKNIGALLSPEFCDQLALWHRIEDKYPCSTPSLGFWRTTSVKVYEPTYA